MIAINNTDPKSVVHVQNGVTFVARRSSVIAPSFRATVLVGAGAFHDEVSGTAHFLEHLICARRFQEYNIADYYTKLGGSFRAGTGDSHTFFSFQVSGKNWRDALKSLAVALRQPVVGVEEIARECKTILNERINGEFSPAVRNGRELRRAAFGVNAPDQVIGLPDGIRRINVDTINDFIRRHYVNENIVVVMEGRGSPAAAIAEAVRHFIFPVGPRSPQRPALEFSPSTLRIPADGEGTEIFLLFPSFRRPASMQTWLAEGFAKRMLYGLAFAMAREEKQLIYGLRNLDEHEQTWGFSGLRFTTMPENRRETIETIMNCAGILASNPNEEQFEFLRGNALNQERWNVWLNPGRDLDRVAEHVFFEGTIPSRLEARKVLKSMTVADIAAHVRDYYCHPLSVVYRGQVEGDCPDHEEIRGRIMRRARRLAAGAAPRCAP